jgi:hypothetical protein
MAELYASKVFMLLRRWVLWFSSRWLVHRGLRLHGSSVEYPVALSLP